MCIRDRYLPEDKFSEEQRENISLLCAVASGIGGLIAIDRLLNKKWCKCVNTEYRRDIYIKHW